MTTEKGITEGGFAEVVTGMIMTGTMRETGMTGGAAGVEVLVLITQEAGAETNMMISIGVKIDQLLGTYLIGCSCV